MANLMTKTISNSQSRQLASKFVFYDQLEKYDPGTIQRSLYDSAISAGEAVLALNKPESRAEFIASNLRAQARNEAQKDIKLLNTYFGGNYSLDDVYDKQFGKELTIALNEALNLKDIFQRNYDRIVNEKGDGRAAKVTISSVMESYVMTEIRNSWPTICNHVLKRLADSNGEYSIAQAIEEEFNSPYMGKIIERALDKALASPTWTGGTNNPFKELVDYLNTHQDRRNYIIAKMWQYLGIDKLKQNMIKNITNSEQLKNFKNSRKSGKVNLTTSIKGGVQRGLMGEALSQVISEAAVKLNTGNSKFTAEQVGSIGAKPDVMLGFQVKVDTVSGIMNNDRFKGSDRETNRDRFIEINEHLKRLNKGIIVYSNVKDYALGQDFKRRGGFSTGGDMTLNTYANIMKKTKTGEFIGTVANAMDKAVFGDEEHRQAILEMITQDMANFLFDDVFTVGKEMTDKGATVIHLMNLDGVYIPVSYLLLLLAEAFEQEDKNNYRDIFYPTIRYPEILYPNGGEGHDGENKWTYEDWQRQRDDALNKITIGAHFARSFVDIVKELK